jgi:ABC-2 type transport system ATP-binding protein
MQTSTISISGLSKRFGQNHVLKDVQLQIPAGCVYALLGENGAGKTTLIRIIMGYVPANAGSISVLGISPERDPFALRRRVGYVSDLPALYEWMTVKQIAWFCSAFYSKDYSGSFARWATQFELPQETRIRHLSKGMRAKTALALVLAAEPELLVFDEPTSGLDPLVRKEFLRSMVDLAAQGKTVLLSSHQVQEVERVADHVAILHDGKIALDGSLDQLKDTVSLLRFSMRDPLALPPASILGLTSIHCEVLGRTIQMAVQQLTPETVELLKREKDISDVQIIRPSLEELFILCTRDSQTPPWQQTWQSKSAGGALLRA